MATRLSARMTPEQAAAAKMADDIAQGFDPFALCIHPAPAIHTVNLTQPRHRHGVRFRCAWWSANCPNRRCHQDYKTPQGARNCAHTMRAQGAVWGKL